MGGADQRPFGAHFLESSQQELVEASGLLDLPEHRLHDLFSQPVAAAVSSAPEFLPHGLGERPASPALFAIGMLGAPRGEIGFDASIGQGLQVGLAAIAAIGRGLLGLAAKIGRNAIGKRDELALIAHAWRQLMGNDDLCGSIHGGLRVVALDIAVLGEQHPAIEIGNDLDKFK